jgi:hypothetical protein
MDEQASSEAGQPGFQANTIDLPVFLRAFTGYNVMDNGLPAHPTLDMSEMAMLFEQWQQDPQPFTREPYHLTSRLST